jgi:glycine/D-amino acid oxidase-like deaminating enzyme
MKTPYKVGIIGGGISGSVIALQLAQHGIQTILFEQGESLVNGPPFCHLHAGGNLYPDISLDQCEQLMRQSIDMARLFPQSIDERPTFISVPKSEHLEVAQMEAKLKHLANYYQQLVDEDASAKLLGPPSNYYTAYSHDELVALSMRAPVSRPQSHDEWTTNATHYINIESLKMPVFMVSEWGWNLFRLAAQVNLALKDVPACTVKTNTKVTDVRRQKLDNYWEIITQDATYNVQYLVNATGHETARIDSRIQQHSSRLIEYKAAYISKWQPIPGLLPELIFHGERGSTHGMAQLTPYSDDFYQIHGMTPDITLFDNGLIQSTEGQSTAEFDADIQQKIARAWDPAEINERTQAAIRYTAQYVPSFDSATVGGPPLHGAQQIPGEDPSLRVGEVCFPCTSYARSEIVKASSALTVAMQIIRKMQEEGVVPNFEVNGKENELLDRVSKVEINELASALASQRGYPSTLSKLLIEKS